MIMINLDAMLARRKIASNDLAARMGITPANLSILKTGKARAIRLSTLEAICRELQCQPGDILEFREGASGALEHFIEAITGDKEPKANAKLTPPERLYKAIAESAQREDREEGETEEKWSDELRGG